MCIVHAFFGLECDKEITYFFRSVQVQRRYDRVKRWTKKINIFQKDFVIIPINENSHWQVPPYSSLPLYMTMKPIFLPVALSHIFFHRKYLPFTIFIE
jgi:hypothetical protein